MLVAMRRVARCMGLYPLVFEVRFSEIDMEEHSHCLDIAVELSSLFYVVRHVIVLSR